MSIIFDDKDQLTEYINANRDYKEPMIVLDCTGKLIDELINAQQLRDAG